MYNKRLVSTEPILVAQRNNGNIERTKRIPHLILCLHKDNISEEAGANYCDWVVWLMGKVRRWIQSHG